MTMQAKQRQEQKQRRQQHQKQEQKQIPYLPTERHSSIVERVPKLARGLVWCIDCGSTRGVDGATCLAKGWPMCCGHTMTIDSPEERAERDRQLVMAHRARGVRA